MDEKDGYKINFARAAEALCRMCGISDSVQLEPEETGAHVRLVGDRLVPLDDAMRDTEKRAGVRSVWGGIAPGRRVVDLCAFDSRTGKGCSDMHAVRNFEYIVPSIGEVRDILNGVPGMGAMDRWTVDKTGGNYTFFVAAGDYDVFRGRIEALADGPWEVTFTGRAPYRFTELGKAAEENASFVLYGATIKPKGVGETTVRALWGEGKVAFEFLFDESKPNAHKALAALLTEMAGRDVVDWEVAE